MATPQSYKNHARFNPLFHFTIVPILLVNFIFAIVYAVRHYPQHFHLALWWIVMSITLLLIASMARGSAMTVQDRVIRLEERMRLAQLASPGELAELESLTMKQYIGLRFASNPEVVELARRAVRENLDCKQIKEAVVSWRADEHRV
ncbi:hypothetical protein GOB94_06270 [Granulicella sp. 5B5]|uniref:DUF6526 family protein n=1 Tax=Granulicella sp. 5B5 TaxID=1617967 RepID=UPI0015F48A94|nr:DUF6526 family protein [Granulicella sp. 5B5]QMV18336.1 hypothetical protein GOB94_06270 [Granulicella sp. 5B5]